MLEYRNCSIAQEPFVVGMAYVPWQKLDQVYENLYEAFKEGTLFPELNKPYVGKRSMKNE